MVDCLQRLIFLRWTETVATGGRLERVLGGMAGVMGVFLAIFGVEGTSGWGDFVSRIDPGRWPRMEQLP